MSASFEEQLLLQLSRMEEKLDRLFEEIAEVNARMASLEASLEATQDALAASVPGARLPGLH